MQGKAVATPAHKIGKLYLHIGAEKTGTTTLQRTLAHNRELLMGQGYLYPKSVGATCHFDLPRYCLDRSRISPLRNLAGMTTPEAVDAGRLKIASALAKEIDAAKPDYLVLSAEQLSSNVLTADEATGLLAWLAPIAEDLQVICYLRPQDQMATSAYSTQVKAGGTAPFESFKLPLDHPKYNYRVLAEIWAAAAGEDKLHFRLFGNRRDGFDILDDFAACIGFDTAEISRLADQNKSLDPIGLELLRRMNHYLPKHGEPGSLRANLQDVLTQKSGPERLRISNAEREHILADFADSNRWIWKRYFSDLPTNPFAFEPAEEPAHSGDTAPPDLSDAGQFDRVAEYAAHLWLSQQKKLQKK